MHTLRSTTFRLPIDACAVQCGASLVRFFDIRLGSVDFHTEPVETITEEVGPERESNQPPPARDSLKHGYANVHMVHAAQSTRLSRR